MKIGIALAGGGSKGAYQVGVWKALRELGVEYHIVTGTSIGAVNGALMVMGDYERAERLWSTVTVEDIMSHGVNLRHDMDYYYENREALLEFAREFAVARAADIEPYKALIHREFDEAAFLASPVDYAAVTARFPSLQLVEARKADMEPGKIEPWLLASSSCAPVFPLCEIDGEKYIDGGYADNLPVSTAFRLGAERVIAVALKPEAFEKTYPHHPLVTRIAPSRPLGPFLDFSREVLERNFSLGHVDALRTFGRYFGEKYAFRPYGEQALVEAAEAFLLWLLRRDLAPAESAMRSMLERLSVETRLSDRIFERQSGDLKTFAARGVEYLMELLDYPHEEVYDVHALLPALRAELLCANPAPAAAQAAALAERLRAQDWKTQLRQIAPGGASDGDVFLAAWRLYLTEREGTAHDQS